MKDYPISKSDGRISMTVNEAVAVDGRTVMFVDDLFYHESGLHGATGSRMCPLTQEEANRRVADAKEYDYSPLAHTYDEENTPESWDEWIADIPEREWLEIVRDPSYTHKYGDRVREIATRYMDYDSEPAHVECVGGGRIFGSINYETVLDHGLLRMVHDAESGDPEWVTPFL